MRQANLSASQSVPPPPLTVSCFLVATKSVLVYQLITELELIILIALVGELKLSKLDLLLQTLIHCCDFMIMIQVTWMVLLSSESAFYNESINSE